MTVDVDRAFSSDEILDMAAAKIAAIMSPTKPIGSWVVTNVGKT